ncbi:alkanesulfonate monooxygenase SsuD/methylene tetrahydromethanopterin reductase-like flavin-dependent oxidoreductase (luciferase family) [Micromonospora vinacea]|uniref:Alkanesulfonate monooxygenase SsuD/methylene tetrahydromethanopterin reductase-like flavin-dependent oxidoreductase (Luciferase family) n=1 Tax=Micromonospora vinacea TaxID=709878 RepID=A0ABS0K979_9ACTN|nr:alkanesulfonate monooxygenase SsuD/methylene tetrahydromethanopterin reductase-like flavin-dependent oxidoreductase (luciferase family) [Micromonospora vinacea]
MLAKTVTTLDVLSGGRARLGIGASWYEREQLGLGVPVVPVAERFERLEETLRICLQMWSADDGPFNGKHYQLAETINSPQPLSRPHPPIMIGGGGEKKTLLLVARYADACNLFGRGGIDDVARKLDVLRGHCAAEGRDYDTIEKTVVASQAPLDDTDAFLAEVSGYAALGVSEVQVTPDRHPVEFAQRLGDEVLPRLADIG